jgi:predicted metal-dependent hydrolase
MAKIQKYTVRQSKRAKRVRLAVYFDGSVIVTTPLGVQSSVIEKFFHDKKQWVLDKLNLFQHANKKGVRTFSRRDYLANKDKVLALVSERIEFYNGIYGFSFHKIFIKNQKTRWGSCSQKKNLNLNYKIAFLPPVQRDYIIVHEMCHLREFNHSHKFWSLVAMTFPDYSEIRKELRDHGLFYK